MSDPGTIRVFLVDDHEVVREGLRRMLASCAWMTIVGSAATGEEALEQIPALAPDVTLLDLSLPGMPGLDVLQRLRATWPGFKVIVLTVHDDQDLVLGAVRWGAQGYVLKQASKEELTHAIRTVARGAHYFSPQVKAMASGDRPAEAQGLSGPLLTPRELEVLRLVSAGAANKEIAEALYLSADTVKTHLANIYKKLGVEGRAHAVAVALRQGLLP
jgi:two-component system, NarL family, response regulator YdfI